jgi:hypothetical protein
MKIGAKYFRAWWRGLLAAWLAAALYSPACAQSADDYPNRPMQLIIAYGAGTIGDADRKGAHPQARLVRNHDRRSPSNMQG